MIMKHHYRRLKNSIRLLILKFRNPQIEKFEFPVCGYSVFMKQEPVADKRISFENSHARQKAHGFCSGMLRLRTAEQRYGADCLERLLLPLSHFCHQPMFIRGIKG